MSTHSKLFPLSVAFLAFVCLADAASAQGSTADPLMSALSTVLDWIKTLGFIYSSAYVLGFIAAFLQLRWWTGILLIVLIPVTVVCGMGAPIYCKLFILWGGQSIGFGAAYGIVVILCIIAMIYYAVMGFLPAIIAYRRGLPNAKKLLMINLLGFIPLVWPVLLYFSLAKLEPDS